MEFGKKDALMTKGLAIICMLVLHLFCRTGDLVYGTPVLWLNDEVPVVYLFGFFGEICVSLYSFVAGYAQSMICSGKSKTEIYKSNLIRIFKLLVIYWIIVVLFSGIGYLAEPAGDIPGSWIDFVKTLLLLHSYNGAWWYLHTYILMILVAPYLVKIMKKAPGNIGLLFCLVWHMIWYIINRMGFLPDVLLNQEILNFLVTELKNLIGVLPVFCAGISFENENYIGKFRMKFYQSRWNDRNNVISVGMLVMLFLLANVIHKAVIMPIIAILVIVVFCLWEKKKWIERSFLFLGRHSTNIWLVHMFFYLYIFNDWMEVVQYPVFILLILMAVCLVISYVIEFISCPIIKKINNMYKV